MNGYNTFAPKLESLDGRIVPAGNVAASIGGEVLELRGDEAANSVLISQASTGRVTVTGLSGTTINGRPSVSFDGSGLEKADIRLFGGNDRLEVRNLRTSVDQTIETDQGDDAVILSGVRAGVNLTVKTGDGTDAVTASGVRTGGDFFVDTEEGNSAVRVSSTQVGKTLTVIGKNGADATTLSGVTTGEDLNVEAGEGNDRVALSTVRVGKNLKVDLDTGNDSVSNWNVVVTSDAVYLGEDGFDTFTGLAGVRAGEKLEIKEFERVS